METKFCFIHSLTPAPSSGEGKRNTLEGEINQIQRIETKFEGK